MAQPTTRDVHAADAALTNISTAYIQDQTNFISTQVFPVVRVSKQSDFYYTWTKADWFRDEAKLRAPSTESEGSGYSLGTANYSCKTYAIHKDIPDEVRNNSDPGIEHDRAATEYVTQQMLQRQENDWVSTYFVTGVWGTTSTPSNLWSDYTASDPISDIETGKRTVLVNTGRPVNTMTMGYDVWIKLKHHPDILERIVAGGGPANPAMVTRAHVASVFEIDRVLVAMAVTNSANEGATASYGFTHGKHCLLTHVASTPSLLTPSAGYTFVWQGESMGFGADVQVSRFDMPLKRAERVEAQMSWDNQIVGSDLGYMLLSVVS